MCRRALTYYFLGVVPHYFKIMINCGMYMYAGILQKISRDERLAQAVKAEVSGYTETFPAVSSQFLFSVITRQQCHKSFRCCCTSSVFCEGSGKFYLYRLLRFVLCPQLTAQKTCDRLSFKLASRAVSKQASRGFRRSNSGT